MRLNNNETLVDRVVFQDTKPQYARVLYSDGQVDTFPLTNLHLAGNTLGYISERCPHDTSTDSEETESWILLEIMKNP